MKQSIINSINLVLAAGGDGIDCHGVHSHIMYFFGLLREGYPVGIPDAHWIDREELA